MATFKSEKTLHAPLSLMPDIAQAIKTEFGNDGYEVTSQPLTGGGYDISIAKGNIFKAVLGMKSALKIGIEPRGGEIYIKAGVGIFGQQAIPTIIMWYFAWPVLLTQLWGMIRQSKLDERAIAIAERCVERNLQQSPHSASTPSVEQSGQPVASCETANHASNSGERSAVYCTHCGAAQPSTSNFCGNCGNKL